MLLSEWIVSCYARSRRPIEAIQCPFVMINVYVNVDNGFRGVQSFPARVPKGSQESACAAEVPEQGPHQGDRRYHSCLTIVLYCTCTTLMTMEHGLETDLIVKTSY
jgi:hypothetical protein